MAGRDLIDFLDQQGVNLVLAAPGREIDLSTPMGRLFVQFTAILDEWYAADISQRAKDNVAYRKTKGQTVGMPPFGTVRGEDGYLKPTPHGAWLLPNGTFATGNEPPVEGATWRGYYDAANFILTLYATGLYGLEKIAYQFDHEGWAFRDRRGTPRPIERDDVRRVVANWAEYGGMVIDRKAKDRPGYEHYDVDTMPFIDERAVFPIILLKAVAKVRQERTVRRIDQSVKKHAYHYALGGLVYCARCEGFAEHHKNAKLRSLLSGNTTRLGVRRYRHKLGVKCGCVNRSVPCDELDAEFKRLISLLVVREDAHALMTELAIQADKARGAIPNDAEDLKREKQEAIALCRKRIDAAVVLFSEGMIDKDEYHRRVEANEREIAHWQSRTNETEKLALELGMCIEAIDKLNRLWDISDEENKQGLARSLFTQLTYDLDTRRIINFRLKPWADRFLMLRASLYDYDGDDDPDGGAGRSIEKPEEQQDAGTEGGMVLPESSYGAQNYAIRRSLADCFYFSSGRPSCA